MRLALRPALALLALLAAVAGLYAWDAGVYQQLRLAAGLRPFPPFLDLHNVMAAIECHGRGVDVYATNPCDALGRLHIYSPLWLRLPRGLGAEWLTLPIGLALALAMVAALLVLPMPRPGREAWLLMLTVLSPATAFALERANMDVLIFAVAVAGALLLGGGWARRAAAHGLFLLVGLLKFYPLVLLALVLRESRPIAAWLLGAAALAVGLAVLPLAGEFGRALANILPHDPFTGTFGARQLAQGLALVGHPALAVAVGVAVAGAAGAVAWRVAAGAASGALPRLHADLLMVGGLLVVGCFVAGQSVEYRGVLLLMAMPGLLALGREGKLAGLFRAVAVAVAWLLWDPVARRLAGRLAPGADGVPGMPALALWTLREVLWWFVVAVLAGLLAGLLRRRAA